MRQVSGLNKYLGPKVKEIAFPVRGSIPGTPLTHLKDHPFGVSQVKHPLWNRYIVNIAVPDLQNVVI